MMVSRAESSLILNTEMSDCIRDYNLSSSIKTRKIHRPTIRVRVVKHRLVVVQRYSMADQIVRIRRND